MTLLSVFTNPSVFGFVRLAIVITAGFAFFDAMTRPVAAWIYAGENRNRWLAITFAAFALPCVIGIFQWVALGAAIFYQVDKKPKLAQYQPPRRRENDLHDNWR
ncbi:hypothetical protein acdb102_10320 [Acidothermaceae bacterium B102]|nr:hypothetical protein acdb102_10320 [Acidothermaceae bacterium B102]